MNTAVLTGRQVSQAMKVFTVSEAGKVTDVTRNSICSTEDERVIKVEKSSFIISLNKFYISVVLNLGIIIM